MKKSIAIILVMCFVLMGWMYIFGDKVDAASFSTELFYDGQPHQYKGTLFSVSVDGKRIDSPIPPIVLANDRSIVAVREVFEAVGANVVWVSDKPQRVLISHGDRFILLTIDSNIAIVNNFEIIMEVPAKLVQMGSVAKTMVPIRFVAEALNMTVDYDRENSGISIYTNNAPSPSLPSVMPPGISSPTPSMIPSTAPTPSPSAAPTANPAGKVISISNTQQGDTLTTTIKLSQPYNTYDDFTLNDPNRVVLDFPGFVIDLPQANYTVGYNTTKIRTSNYLNMARIVFDVNTMPKYEIVPSGDKKTIVVKLTAKYNKAAPIVVIDAGHGGEESGAIGYKDGKADLVEKVVNLDVSMMVVDILKKNGVDVRTTRTTDKFVSLSDRTDYANSIDASLFVSIHCNAFTTEDVNGTLVMHHTTKDTSAYGVSGKQLAQNIMDYMVPSLGTKDMGRINGSSMWVIRKANMPSVIVEMAFITNESDRQLLKTNAFRAKAAESIAKGIMKTIPMLEK